MSGRQKEIPLGTLGGVGALSILGTATAPYKAALADSGNFKLWVGEVEIAARY
jgi:hypothetical protein